MSKSTVPEYDIEELYTYEEAAKVAAVKYSAITEAVRFGVLTSTRLPDHPNRKFVLRSEIDALAGTGKVGSKEARAKVAEVRRNAIQAQSDKDYNVDGTPDYISKNELVAILKEQGIQFEQILAAKLQEQTELFMRWMLELVDQNPGTSKRVKEVSEAISQLSSKPPREFLKDVVELIQ